jgi:hypothetical protein
MLAGRLLKLLQQLCFESFRIDGHFAGGNLFLGGAVITKLAHGETFLRAYRRSKDAASNRSMKVQIAEAGGGIERCTRLVVGKVLKTGLRLLRGIQKSRLGITREPRAEAFDRSPSPLANRLGSLRLSPRQLLESLLQTFCI